MKFWTLQTKRVIEEALNSGVYQPDFAKSTYLQEIPEFEPLYDLILDSYNQVNGDNRPGLIFSFLYSDDERCFYFDSFDAFYAGIQKRKAAILSLWKHLKATPDMYIVELKYDGPINFNPILIDINDFQFLRPPISFPFPYVPQDVERLHRALRGGYLEKSRFPSYLIQAHLPCIQAKNIGEIYEVFDLEP